MQVLRTIAEVRGLVASWTRDGHRVGLVPTMGALHEGHVSLVGRARAVSSRTLVSIFVNPSQFGPNEDFTRYPRDEQRDLAMLEAAGTDAVFLPSVEEMYGSQSGSLADLETTVQVERLSAGLCGAHRPGHFTGVATVVLKLLLIAGADVAVFGEKDYQQLQIIRRMVRDLNVPVTIEAAPIVREPDGLAMSSRNAYLSADLRSVAPALHELLLYTRRNLERGQGVSVSLADMRERLAQAGFSPVDYVALVDAESLEPLDALSRPARLLAAAWLGRTRLIDNVPIVSPS